MLPALRQLGEDFAWQLVKGGLVAEKIGFVVEQGLDHLGGKITVVGASARLFEQADKLVDIADPMLADHARQCGPDPPAAAFGEVLAGMAFEQVGNDLV